MNSVLTITRYLALVSALIAGIPSIGCGTSENSSFCDAENVCRVKKFYCDVKGELGLANACVARPACQTGCGGQAPVCEATDGLCRNCRPGIDGDKECTALDPNAPMCAASGECLACGQAADGDARCAALSSEAPYCLGQACVQCRTDDDCSQSENLVCGDDHTCQECREHTDCTGPNHAGICMPTTSECVLKQQVIYVDQAQSKDKSADCGTALGQDACETIGQALARLQADPSKSTIKIAFGVYEETLVIDNLEVFMVGEHKDNRSPEQTMLQSLKDDSSAIEVTGGAQLVVDTMMIQGKSRGFQCDDAQLSMHYTTILGAGRGINASGCHVVVKDSTISNNHFGVHAFATAITIQDTTVSGHRGNAVFGHFDSTVTIQGADIHDNAGLGIFFHSGGDLIVKNSMIYKNVDGGIQVSSSNFAITNNFIVRNGHHNADSTGSFVGGVSLANDSQMPRQIFAFNTVVQNRSQKLLPAKSGVSCRTEEPMIAEGNIVYGGVGGSSASGNRNCFWSYSNIEGGIEGSTDRLGNIDADPRFVDPDNDTFQAKNYTLTADSPCIDQANPNATLTTDFEGTKRPTLGKTELRSDIGADEYEGKTQE